MVSLLEQLVYVVRRLAASGQMTSRDEVHASRHLDKPSEARGPGRVLHCRDPKMTVVFLLALEDQTGKLQGKVGMLSVLGDQSELALWLRETWQSTVRRDTL